MSTRGAMGFVINGEETIAYNHHDSYPEGRGLDTLRFLREFLDRHSVDELRRRAKAIQLVSDDTPATPQQILDLRKFSDFQVGNFPMSGPEGGLPTENVDWYNLLRKTQGDWWAILDAGYMEDGSLFPLDSLFCEWGYIIDLDAEVLEVYGGFNKELPTAGRWAGRPTPEEDEVNYAAHLQWCKENDRDPWMPRVSEWKASELKATFPLAGLPTDEEFLNALAEPVEVS